MKKWMLYLEKKRLLPNQTLDHGQYNYGDWVEAGSMDNYAAAKEYRCTSDALISSAYFHHNCCILSRIAKSLGYDDDERYFAQLAEKTAAGFQKRFFDAEKNKFERESQFSYLLPLAFDLVPADRRDAVAANLVEEILERNHGHLGVGLIGMQWYMQTLSNVAYTVATQTTRPSWGYMISKGGTSIWERWNQDTCDPGMNGESQLILAGDLTTWYYKSLAGIGYDPAHPGFKHIILRPQPVGDLRSVNAAHVSLYGKIISRWKIEGSDFHWDITVPPDTTATVFIPAKYAAAVSEGGMPAEKSPGLKFLRREDGAAVFSAISGQYSLASH